MEELLRPPSKGAERLDDRASGLRLLFRRDDAVDFEEILSKHLSTKHRLLYHMICKILIPRIGRFDYVTRNNVAIMYHILKRKKFNLPVVMLRIMQEA